MIPKLKPPVTYEFHRDGDVGDLREVLKRNASIEILAAVGSGKSTRIPLEIASVTNQLVVHTVPFVIAARALYEYLSKVNSKSNYLFLDEGDFDKKLPESGVVITSNAYFLGRCFHDGWAGRNDIILYLDESHESDCWTAVARTAALGIRCVNKLIKATATSGLAAAPTSRMPSPVVMKSYARPSTKTWSADDVDMPWNADHIHDNTWIFLDNEESRRRLHTQYTDAGFRAWMISERTTWAEWVMLHDSMADQVINVVIATTAYQSSINVRGVKTWICSGEVRIPIVLDGQPAYMYRNTFQGEMTQRIGRAGRFGRESSVFWVPDLVHKNKICDMEKLEIDAANLLFRMLGRKPPVETAGAAYYDGKVPIDLVGALTSESPLRLVPEASLEEWTTGYKPGAKVKDPHVYQLGLKRGVSCHTVAQTPPVPAFEFKPGPTSEGTESVARLGSRSSMESVASVMSRLDAYDSDYKPARQGDRSKQKMFDERIAAAEKTGFAGYKSKPLPEMPRNELTDFAAHTGVSLQMTPEMRQAVTDRVFGALPRPKPVEDDHRLQAVIQAPANEYMMSNAVMNKTTSKLFLDVDSVVRHYEAVPNKAAMFSLPAVDREAASILLLHHCNLQLATAIASTRIVKEVVDRVAEVTEFWDQRSFGVALDQVKDDYSAAISMLYQGRAILEYVSDCAVFPMPPLVDLEQRIMTDIKDKLIVAAKVQPPDKTREYARMLTESTSMRYGVKGRLNLLLGK